MKQLSSSSSNITFRKMISHNYVFNQKKGQWFLPTNEENPKGYNHYCQIEYEIFASNLAILFHHSCPPQVFHILFWTSFVILLVPALMSSLNLLLVFTLPLRMFLLFVTFWSYVLTIWKLNNDLVILFTTKSIMEHIPEDPICKDGAHNQKNF